jgi:hypothetical protein
MGVPLRLLESERDLVSLAAVMAAEPRTRLLWIVEDHSTARGETSAAGRKQGAGAAKHAAFQQRCPLSILQQ